MARLIKTRKARFQSALALTGMTQAKWAEEVAGISRCQLNLVLNGKRESKTLATKIDGFIEKVEAKSVRVLAA